VKVTSLVHLNHTQFGRFEESSKVYCRVMDVDHNEAARQQLF